jgi:DNA polymerase-3 subunit gamma/tau
MIARAAEGSARDALSILDQAIAHAAGTVEGETVQNMLGLADRALIIDLFAEVMGGDVAGAIARLKALHEVGADPVVVLEDLAAFTHLVTRLKLAPAELDDQALTEEERSRGKEFAEKLSLRVLVRAWQMLLKGIEEAQEASRPLAAADMVLVRLAHVSDLPTPDEALRVLRDGGGVGSASTPGPAAASPDSRTRMAVGGGSARPAPQPRIEKAVQPVAGLRLETFADVVALAAEKRELKLRHALEHEVRLIRFEPGRIEIGLTEHAPPTLANVLSTKLEEWTGRRWMIVVGAEQGAPTIAEERRNARAQLVDDARADPLVAAAFARFPGAEIVDVRVRAQAEPEPVSPAPPAESDPDGSTLDD